MIRTGVEWWSGSLYRLIKICDYLEIVVHMVQLYITVRMAGLPNVTHISSFYIGKTRCLSLSVITIFRFHLSTNTHIYIFKAY